MTNWDHIRKSAARLLEQPGLTVEAIWNGQTIRGVKTTLKRDIVAMDDGLAGRYDVSFRVAAKYFAFARPKAREVITMENRRFRILSVEDDAIGATVLLNLGEETA